MDNNRVATAFEHRFIYHAPTDAERDFYQRFRAKAGELARFLEDECKGGREKSLAVTKLEEAAMWGNASVARSGLKGNDHDSR